MDKRFVYNGTIVINQQSTGGVSFINITPGKKFNGVSLYPLQRAADIVLNDILSDILELYPSGTISFKITGRAVIEEINGYDTNTIYPDINIIPAIAITGDISVRLYDLIRSMGYLIRDQANDILKNLIDLN